MTAEFQRLMAQATDRAARLDDPARAREIFETARILESRRLKFIISWCLAYLGFDQIFLGYDRDLTTPWFYDRTRKTQHRDVGAGVLKALSLCNALARWSGGSILALEHPDAGFDEKHLAPMTKLLVSAGKAESNADLPWWCDLVAWLKSGASLDFESHLPPVS